MKPEDFVYRHARPAAIQAWILTPEKAYLL